MFRSDYPNFEELRSRSVSHRLANPQPSGLTLASLYISDLLAGLGFSSPLVLLMTVVQLSTPPLFIGIASALTISARTLGGTVGYAIAEVIYSNRSGSRLANNIGESSELKRESLRIESYSCPT